MGLQKLENASGFVGFTSGVGTAAGSWIGWLNENATMIGLAIALLGLFGQLYFAWKRDSREEDEHRLRIENLRDDD